MRKISSVKLERYMRHTFVVLTALAAVYNIIDQQWEIFFSAITTLILFLLPTIFTKRTRISIPAPFQIVILIFIFASMYLGEIHSYFYRYRWWDLMLHSLSAVILAYVGFLLIYALNKDRRIEVKINPFFMALFSFCFAVMIGTIWEIFEYLVDASLGVNMQKARNLEQIYGFFDTRLGVMDTMQDFIVNTIGALLVSTIGYSHIKHRKDEDSAFWIFHRQFIEENPELFGEEPKQRADSSSK
nr:hypothetical protein [Candidatus Cloacimonadota bacterium]